MKTVTTHLKSPYFYLGLLVLGFLMLGLALLPPAQPVYAQAGTSLSLPMSGDAYDFETLTVSSTAVGLTAAKVSPASGLAANIVQITCRTAAVRYRYDGGNPTASVGHEILVNGERFIYGMNNVRRLKLIRESGDASCDVTYIR